MADAKLVMKLRDMTGAGVLEAKKALEESGDNLEAAAEALRKSGVAKAAKKSDRVTSEGVVHAYTHGSKIGVMVELLCETDFVARNPEFQGLAHDIAMQIAATSPLYVSPEQVPAELIDKEKEIYRAEVTGKPAEIMEKIVAGKLDKWFSDICLTKQAFVKDEDVTIEELIKSAITKLGENMQIRRFVRFNLDEKV